MSEILTFEQEIQIWTGLLQVRSTELSSFREKNE